MIEADTFTRAIMLKSFDDKIFSDGIDFQILRKFLKFDQKLEMQNFFFNLTRFSHMIANYKKPMMIDINGVLKNVSASIFLNRPMLVNKTFSSACKYPAFFNLRPQ